METGRVHGLSTVSVFKPHTGHRAFRLFSNCAHICNVLLHLCCITVRVTQELLPLSSSLQRGSQEVRGHVRELGGLPVGVDGPVKHVVAAQLLGHVVLCLHTEPR